MRLLRVISLLALIYLAGCDRGSQPELVGRAAPDFSVSDGERSAALHDYRGRTVVLNFWATWCPPCVEELPSLVEMQAKMKPKVVVLAISLDEDPAAYKKFVAEHAAGLFTVRDAAKSSSNLYGTFAYPETYVIDRNGIVRRKFIGPVDWSKPDITGYLSQL